MGFCFIVVFFTDCLTILPSQVVYLHTSMFRIQSIVSCYSTYLLRFAKDITMGLYFLVVFVTYCLTILPSKIVYLHTFMFQIQSMVPCYSTYPLGFAKDINLDLANRPE